MDQVVHANKVELSDIPVLCLTLVQEEGAKIPNGAVRYRGCLRLIVGIQYPVQRVVLVLGEGVDAAEHVHPLDGVVRGTVPHRLLYDLLEEVLLFVIVVARHVATHAAEEGLSRTGPGMAYLPPTGMR